jgi:hypothetical protein
MPANRQLIHRTASSYNQRHHNHHRIRNRLREPRVGFPNAHPHRHQLLPHPAGPESVEDGFRGDVAEVDQGRSVAASDSLVLHSDDERVQYGKGTKEIRTLLLFLLSLVLNVSLTNTTALFRCCSNGAMSAATRSIVSRIGWTSASPKAPWTTSRKAEMVSDRSRISTFRCTLTDRCSSAYNILMDFIFAIYPWLIMWKLDMKKSEKLGLCIVMSLVSHLPHYQRTALILTCTP